MPPLSARFLPRAFYHHTVSGREGGFPLELGSRSLLTSPRAIWHLADGLPHTSIVNPREGAHS